MSGRALGLSSEAYENKFELRVILLCTMAGTLMQALDSTIANVALPYIQGGLAASRDQITWVLTSYIVSSAIMTAPSGWIASRFGRKNFMMVCLAGFTITSMMCGAAQTLDQIILFRVFQGAFGAALQPLSQSILVDLYPTEKRGSIMAIWGMGVMVGPILGPTLGGYLTDFYSWRWVFYVNAPFGIAALTGIALFFRDTNRAAELKFDWFGFGMLAVGLGALQVMLDRGSSLDWFGSSEIVIEAVIAGLGLYLFAVHLLTSDGTFIPKQIFRDRAFLSSLMLMFTLGLVMLASTALLPPYLQDLGGYSVRDTGILMAPRGVGTMVAMVISGRLALRFGPRNFMLLGTVCLLASMWEMSRWMPEIPAWHLMATTFIQGMGTGMMFVPLNLISFATLPPMYRTDASALTSLLRSLGSAIGISITTTFLADSTQTVHAQLAQYVTPFNRALAQNTPSMFWDIATPFGLQSLDAVVQRNAEIIAYANDFLFMTFISLPAILIVLLIRQPAAPVVPREIEVME